ncbi:MAG: AAA family ATPase [Acidimicrobiales bacterium]|nr:AAA family ATPase [Acidimicrobiales bacterium]
MHDVIGEEIEYPFPLLIIAGKGGVGKTVVTAALGTVSAQRGHSTLVVELGGQRHLPPLLVDDPSTDRRPDNEGIVKLSDKLSWISFSPERLLAGWLSGRSMGLIADRLESSGALAVIASSVPGIQDALMLGRLRAIIDTGRFDRVIVDGPASGRARELLRAPGLLAEVASEGPIASQVAQAIDLITNPDRTAVLLVTLPEETPVNETIETAFDIEDDPGVALAGVVVNRVFPAEPPPKAAANHPQGEVLTTRHAALMAAHQRFDEELPIPRIAVPERAGGVVHPSHVVDLLHGGATTEDAHAASVQPEGTGPGAAEARDAVLGRRIVITVGTGGVGKTTVGAALAHRAADEGKKVALVTIDPARRLADALGLDALDDDLRLVYESPSGGSFHATMLETASTFQRIVRRYAETTEKADHLLSSPLSTQLSNSLTGMTEYMAVERLFELAMKDFDLVVVDTPPSADALAFLDAPALLARLLDNRIYRLLVHDGRKNVVSRALGGLVTQLVSIVGGKVVADAVAFFKAFGGMEAGFRQRADDIYALLRSDDTAFVVVTAPTEASLENAEVFVEQLLETGVSPDLTIANRCTPDPSPSSRTKSLDAMLEHLRIRHAYEQASLATFRRQDTTVLTLDELPGTVASLAAVKDLSEQL